MKKKYNFIAIILLLANLLYLPFYPAAAAEQEGDFSVAAKAAISVDEDTGKILYEQNSDQVVGIASTTKLLSLYIIEKEIKAGRLKWEDPVEISEKVAKLSQNSDLSNVPLYTDQKYTVKDLFHAAVIESANAAVQALASKVSGSENKFVDRMKEELDDIGITDAQIVNSSGLPNEYLDEWYPGTSKKDENKMSAKDMAILTRHLLQEFPDFLKVSSITKETFGAATAYPYEMVTFNKMLTGMSQAKKGVDGLKTGTTDLAGACFVGTIEKNGRRVITVVLNATNHKKDEAARFKETSALMDYSFSHWQEQTVLRKGSTVPQYGKVAVSKGKELTTAIVTGKDVKLWLPQGSSAASVKYKVKLDSVSAPLKKNQKAGTVKASVATDKYGYLPDSQSEQTDLLIKKDNPKANFFVLLWRQAKAFITN